MATAWGGKRADVRMCWGSAVGTEMPLPLVVVLYSHSGTLVLNVLGYQPHILQRYHTA